MRARRLAVVDLDWEHVKAVDILAVLQSFVPKGGAIRSVTVYPSDYGLARMQEERVMGPTVSARGAAPADPRVPLPACMHAWRIARRHHGTRWRATKGCVEGSMPVAPTRGWRASSSLLLLEASA